MQLPVPLRNCQFQLNMFPWMRASPSRVALCRVSDLGCRKVVATPPGLPPRLKAYAPATHSTPCYSATATRSMGLPETDETDETDETEHVHSHNMPPCSDAPKS